MELKTSYDGTLNFTPCQRCVGAFSGFDGEKVISGPLRCNSWICPDCQKRLKAKLKSRILNGEICQQPISKYGLKFLTLTFGGTDARKPYITMKNGEPLFIEGIPQYDATAIYDVMILNFHKLIKALKKNYGHFHYFRVTETHKDGVPHFHILLVGNAVIPKSLLSSVERLWCERYGMGFVKLNTPKEKTGKTYFNDAKHAINYMLKYITKDMVSAGRYKRVFSASRGSLVRLQKRKWEKMEIYMGRVDDNGIHEEKIEIDGDFALLDYGETQRYLQRDRIINESVNRLLAAVVVQAQDDQRKVA